MSTKLENEIQTDLTLLLSISPLRRQSKFYDRAKQVMEIIRTYGKVDSADIAKRLGVAKFTVSQLLSELRKAAASGVTLEQYIEQGRQHNPAKKVLA